MRLLPGTFLRRIAGADELAVNSAHHQAVKDAAPGLVVDAVAEDGVIEGIEDPRRRFCVGVQWHPEYLLSDGDRRLFAAFIAACAPETRCPRASASPSSSPAPACARAARPSAGLSSGRVSLGGQVLTSPAVSAGEDDDIRVDGKPLPARERARLWRYHKPSGLVTTHHDERGRDTVFAHLPQGSAARRVGRAARPQFRGAAAPHQ